MAGLSSPFYHKGYVAAGKEEKMSVDVQAIREEMEREGYGLSDPEFSRVLQISYRKMKIAAQPEEYLSLLLPDMIREAVFRKAINTVGIGILILKEKEALENGANDNRGVGGIHPVKAYGGIDEAQKGVAARF